MLDGEAFFHSFNARMTRAFIERFVISIAHSTIAYRLWDDGWEEAYSTMWLYALVTVNLFEFAYSSSATHIVDGSLHLDSCQASMIQALAMWVFYTSAALFAVTAVDVKEYPDSQEFIEKLCIVGIILLTTLWRLVDVWYMKMTTIPSNSSRVTGTPIFLGDGKVTSNNGRGGYNVAEVADDVEKVEKREPTQAVYKAFRL